MTNQTQEQVQENRKAEFRMLGNVANILKVSNHRDAFLRLAIHDSESLSFEVRELVTKNPDELIQRASFLWVKFAESTSSRLPGFIEKICLDILRNPALASEIKRLPGEGVPNKMVTRRKKKYPK